ncbi:Brp/Blh family beta-carotene 15,15'-dioxygenase [Halorientalis salina]|uniref:Brp/Blh family beta-carotene 15,15'-dioxygenase n=1 Tax=Halorientalis salina TaxID=2932266 RepID=UPI0010ACA8A8|nr:Brp/Blh family beta-carotene 15,15'-dioxygenase [Halorientalis salina]
MSESVPGVDLAVRARATLTRAVCWPAWLLTGALVVPFLVGLTVPLRVQLVPLVASVVVLGLPHGAVDHLAAPRVRGQPATWRAMAAVGLLYLVLGVAYAALWFLAPEFAFVSFILLTWFHWGQGDLYALRTVSRVDYLDDRYRRWLAVAVRGGLPMLVPLLSFPGWYRRVARALVSPFEVGSVAGLAWLFRVETRLALGVGFGLLVAGYLTLGYVRTEDRSAWAVDAGETLLLAAYFLVVPPLLAVGVYFCVWHSLRHIARLVVLDERTRDTVRSGRFGSALGRFAVEATPLTLAALALLGGLWLVVPRQPGDLLGLVALYLVLIAALTLPHVAVVTLMDREQGVWR